MKPSGKSSSDNYSTVRCYRGPEALFEDVCPSSRLCSLSALWSYVCVAVTCFDVSSNSFPTPCSHLHFNEKGILCGLRIERFHARPECRVTCVRLSVRLTNMFVEFKCPKNVSVLLKQLVFCVARRNRAAMREAEKE
jgi:hypothetical protein